MEFRRGKRLWEQIGHFIQHSEQCDGWMIYATQSSLSSEPCKEELAYALQRALQTRGDAFPVIALFPGAVEAGLLPPALSVRLCVSATDRDWKERIGAAVEQRSLNIASEMLEPYSIEFHRTSSRHFIEMRPRAGTWSPVFAAIPNSERDEVDPVLVLGPRGRVPTGAMIMSPKEFLTPDREWCVVSAQNQASPIESCFMQCLRLPTKIKFSQLGGIQYHSSLNGVTSERFEG